MLSLGLSLWSSTILGNRWSPARLFSAGEEGAWYEPSPTTCFTDASGTVAATYGDEVQYLEDLSGNGNHATQGTLASRPILARVPETGRRNLLEYTEDLTNGVWIDFAPGSLTVTSDQAADINGLTTLDKVEITDTTNEVHAIQQLHSGPSGNATASCVVKYDASQRYVGFRFYEIGNTWVTVVFDLLNNSVTSTQSGTSGTYVDSGIVDLGDGLRRIWAAASLTHTRLTLQFFSNATPSLDSFDGTQSYAGTAGSYIYAGNFQFEAGSTLTAYQKVVDEYDVTEAGVTSLDYLSFDGSDDGMVFSTITLPDEQSVLFAFEPSAEITSASSGQSVLRSPDGDTADFRGIGPSFGATTSSLSNERLSWLTVSGISPYGRGYKAANIPANPQVFTTTFGNAASSTAFRIDGSAVSTVAASTGDFTGTISPQRYGRIGTGNLSGKLFSLILRGAEGTTQEISQTETYLANRSGVSL